MSLIKKRVIWERHPSHLMIIFSELSESLNFSDVTIICERHSKIKAHKVILASYSDFFRDLFSDSDEEVIFMPEVNQQDLKTIFDLLFKGTSLMKIGRLSSIISLAESLQIRNFNENMFMIQSVESKEDNKTSLREIVKREIPPKKVHYRKIKKIKEPINQHQHSSLEDNESKDMLRDTFKEEKLPNQEKLTLPENKTQNKIIRTWNLEHMLNDKIGAVKFLKNSKDFYCLECGKEFQTGAGLSQHNKSDHLGKRYACDNCGAEFKTKERLRTHFRVFHEGIKFECTLCNASFTTKAALKTHNECKHEGRKFKCHLCSKEFGQRGALKAHLEGQHYGIRYQCLYCHRSSKDPSNLNKHMKKMHPDIYAKTRDPLSLKKRKLTSNLV